MSVFETGLIFAVIYLIIFAAITATANTAFEDVWEVLVCVGPNYDQGWDEVCAPANHPAPYSDDVYVIWNATGAWYSGGSDWTASVPTGWAVYTGHVILFALSKLGSMFSAIVALFVTPTLSMYGQTVNASALGWLNGGLFAFLVFGVIALAKGWL